MAVSESNTAVTFADPTSDVKKEGIIATKEQQKPNTVVARTFSEIDRYLDQSHGSGEDSGHSETEAYDETCEPVKQNNSADFAVDLSKLTPEEVADLLKHTKETGEARRAQNAQELLAMQQKLKTTNEKLQRKIGTGSTNVALYEGMTNVSLYRQAMKTDLPLPTYVTTNQIQLCRAFHVHEIYMNQIKKMQKRNKKLISFLRKQIKFIKEESKRREIPLRKEVELAREPVIKMCRTLEIDPDDWRKPSSGENNELMQRISELVGIPMLNEWFTGGSSVSTSPSISSRTSSSTARTSTSTRTSSQGSK